MTKATGNRNPTYKSILQEMWHMALMVEMGLWSKAAIGRAFGVHPKSVTVNHRRFYEIPSD